MVKNRLKDDIKFMLTSLVSNIQDKNEDYDNLIADIYNELDNLSVIDLYVTREYVKDSIESLTADRKPEKTKTIAAAQMRVISDSVGNYYVVVNEGGQEKIVFQTNNKAKADEFIRNNQQNAAMAAAPEDDLDSDTHEDLTSIPKDDLPKFNTGKNNKEDELDINVDEEEFEDNDNVGDKVLEEINELTERADHLISAIDNAIDVVPDLDAITDLVNIKITIQDRLDELNSTNPNSPDLDEAMEALRNDLEEYESKALDIINKSSPGNIEGQVVVEDEVEEELEDEKDKEDKEDILDDEADEADVDKDELDEDLGDLEDIDDESELADDIDEEKEETSGDIEELIDALMQSIEDIEEKVQDLKNIAGVDNFEDEFVDELEDDDLEDDDLADLDGESNDLDDENLDMPKDLSKESDEFIDEELDEDLEESDEDDLEKVESLEGSSINPFDWESLEDDSIVNKNKSEIGKEDKALLPEDNGVSGMNKSEIGEEDKDLLPEGDGVAEIGRNKPDKEPDDELPLEGKNPLKADSKAPSNTN